MSQELALEAIRNGENVLVTGSAGTGKTYVMKQIIDNNTVVCAPTGIAALNIGGITCHKAFGLPIGLVTDQDYKLQSDVRDLLRYVDRIICDEAGMVRADQFDLIEWKLRMAKGSNEPFGGVQMILVGDFFQLSPIVQQNERHHFRKEYNTPYCFGADSFQGFRVIELQKVYRQDNKRQVAMLNSIRKKDKWYRHAIANISNESKPYNPDSEVLHLCTTKASAKRINETWYNKLDTKQHTFYALEKGTWKDNEIPVDRTMNIRIGARVIICANDMNGMYVNGDRGTVLGLDLDRAIVRKDNGQVVTVVENKWEKYDYSTYGGTLSKEVAAEYTQVPLKLGWAITIHSAQGLTLDDVAIELGNGCFTHGQLYVALSRVKDLRNLSLASSIRHNDVIVDDDVINFYKDTGEDNV